MEISSTAGFHEIADPGYTVVSDRAGFDRMMEALHAAPRLAVDIEADSLYHYFDKVCLIQISTDESTFVLDPLAVEQVLPLGAIFASERVETVFHAASYDTFCLGRDYGFTFARIFDTHVAAQLLGFVQLGLGALLEALMDVTHSKRRQRDDWSRRPLDPEQLEYAANDTRHLLGLRDLLERRLEEKGRLGWAREEFAAAAAAFPQEKIFDPEGFRRIKGSRDLSLSELAALRALYLLRDAWARDLDLPPFKVLNNSTLVDLARTPPAKASELFRRPGISIRVARKYGAELVRAVEKARSEDPSWLALPPRKGWRAPSQEAKRRLELLRVWRDAKAKELELPVGVVFPGNLLEALSLDPPPDRAALEQAEGMRAWRAHVFGAELLPILRA